MWIIKVALSEQMVSSFDTPRWGVDDVKNPIGRPGRQRPVMADWSYRFLKTEQVPRPQVLTFDAQPDMLDVGRQPGQAMAIQSIQTKDLTTITSLAEYA